MITLLRVELCKALRSKWFALALGAGSAIALAAALWICGDYLVGRDGIAAMDYYFNPSVRSSFRFWMSVEYDYPLPPLFYQLAPLLAVAPFAWSMRTEMLSGYVGHMFTRVPRFRYVLAKGVATFVSGGLVAAVPQVLNFAVVSAFVPAITPDIRDEMYLGISAESLWSYQFYNEPFLYVALFCLLGFVLCGLWALLVMSLSHVVENRIVLLTLPYLALVVVQFVNENIFTAVFGGVHAFQFGLLGNLRAVSRPYGQDGWVILALALCLLVSSLVLMRACAKRDLL
ncbi:MULTISPECIES: hypothetical protein [unclassified Adlercreutzia]|uniref:hypothetical protein n=1 Tax=unclassified Adlercreutzia TaxID=2636013 RepID=UPI0013EB6B1C|nr:MULTISPECIES: hypothetical protein [unclassified Adlercreutzia]